MKLLARVLNDWFTGIDGVTMDPARFLWFTGIIAFLTFTSVDIYRHDKFDMETFAFAYASLLAAGAAGIKIKETTEPCSIAVSSVPVVPSPPIIVATTPTKPTKPTKSSI